MRKEKIPKFFSFDILNVCITIISFIALFSFWGKLEDIERFIYIVIPIILVFLLVNIVKYCMQVNKFYKKYSDLYNNNQGLIQNYKDNKAELKQEKYNNIVLREFVNNTMAVLILYNDLTKEERKTITKQIISKFVNNNSKGGDRNE